MGEGPAASEIRFGRRQGVEAGGSHPTHGPASRRRPATATKPGEIARQDPGRAYLLLAVRVDRNCRSENRGKLFRLSGLFPK